MYIYIYIVYNGASIAAGMFRATGHAEGEILGHAEGEIIQDGWVSGHADQKLSRTEAS